MKLKKAIEVWKKTSTYALPVIDELVAFKTSPGWIGAIRMGLRLNGYAESMLGKEEPVTFLTSKDWKSVCTSSILNKNLIARMDDIGCKRANWLPDESKYRRTMFTDEFGRSHTVGELVSNNTFVYVEKNRPDTEEYLRDLFWKHFNDRCLIDSKGDNKEFEFVRSEQYDSFETELSRRYTADILGFRAKGYCHSVLFYGPPGTGKSNIAAQILKNCGYRTLVLGEGTEMGVSWYAENLPFLQPQAILIEDMDHIKKERFKSLLASLEYFAKNNILVLGTANKVGEMDDALIRSGRFDETVEIVKLPSEVIRGMLDGDEEIFNIVEDLPITAIIEVKKRLSVLGRAETLRRMNDLIVRAQRSDKKEYRLEVSNNNQSRPVTTPTAEEFPIGSIKFMLNSYWEHVGDNHWRVIPKPEVVE